MSDPAGPGEGGPVAAVVLAAGGSVRLGRPKPLLEYRGTTLLRHVVDCATGAGCAPVLVVVGAGAEEVRAEAGRAGAGWALNTGWREGMAASIRVGTEALEDRDPAARAVLLLACDQPLITARLLRTVCERFDGRPGRIVACSYGGTTGIPALFERSLFPELRALRGDRGARVVVRRHREALLTVPWSGGAFDIDSPEDHERWTGCLPGGTRRPGGL